MRFGSASDWNSPFCSRAFRTAPRPSFLLKKKTLRKSLNSSPPGAESSKSGAGELLRRHAARRGGACRNHRQPELLDRAAVDLGDADLQHHLLAPRAARQLQQVDDAGLGSTCPRRSRRREA